MIPVLTMFCSFFVSQTDESLEGETIPIFVIYEDEKPMLYYIKEALLEEKCVRIDDIVASR